MNVADFDFDLPDELIAQEPSRERSGSRLLVLNRWSGELQDTTFSAIGNYLRPGDLLVVNNTRVFPARLRGHRVPSGGEVECLLIKELPVPDPCLLQQSVKVSDANSDAGVGHRKADVASSEHWEALMHPGQKLRPGAHVIFEGDGERLHGEVLAQRFFGRRTVRLWTSDGTAVRTVIDRLGHIPLPPYIKRDDTSADRDRYQTVYARERGSIAAPTAGLHFTAALLADLRGNGVEVLEVTLHVGYGTFKPVRTERVEDHVVDAEAMTVTTEGAAILTAALHDRRRIIAVGTTTARALESLSIDNGHVQPASGTTEVFLRPGHDFKIIQGLITNFHLPRSSLLMLVAAFAGREQVLHAYRHAVAQRYRFYSYGDAMLIV